ncbi:MAG: hypothetical protein AAB778_01275 [Patescibacteria group bacterium]
MNFADANARAIIAFSLTLIAALLVYIAFYKDSSSKKKFAK